VFRKAIQLLRVTGTHVIFVSLGVNALFVNFRADVNPDVNPRSDEDIWEEWHPLNSSGKNERSDDQEQKDKSSEKGNGKLF